MLINEFTEKGKVIVYIYIDDTLCLGDKEVITVFKNELV